MIAPQKPEVDVRTFTSRKLDMIDALTQDRRLSAVARLVGVRLLQHENKVTGAIFPSQARLATQVGCSPRYVTKCIKELIDASWIVVSRPHRHRSNIYTFLRVGENAVLDQSIIEAEGGRDTGTTVPVPRDTKGTAVPLGMGATVHPGTGTRLHANTFSIPPEVEHLKLSEGLEGEALEQKERDGKRALQASAPAIARDRSPIPVSESLASTAILRRARGWNDDERRLSPAPRWSSGTVPKDNQS